MNLPKAVTVCIQDYYTFSGRARRSEYWWFILFVTVVSVILSAIDSVIFGMGMLLGLNGLFGLLTLVPQLAVSWRRMHDTGRSGWFNLLPVAPLVLLFPLLLIGFLGRSLFDPPLFDSADVVVFYIFSLVIFVIAMIRVVIWLVLPSQSGENRFGPEPPP